MIKKLFTKHPADFNETYLEHCFQSLSFSFRLIGAGLCCLLHAFFPFIFQYSARNCAAAITKRMAVRSTSTAATEQLKNIKA